MHFRDDNTLEDICGAILVLSADLRPGSSGIQLNQQFDDLVARIEDKLARNTNAIRANWFMLALSHARNAKARFESRDQSGADAMLKQCREYLESRNKAHRRKAAFIVSPEGTVHPK